MKEFLVITKCETLGPLSYNGFIIESVQGKEFARDERFFAYKNLYDNRIYLVDKASGLALGSITKWKWLEDSVYLPRLEAYENYIKNPKYQEKVQRFEQLKENSL